MDRGNAANDCPSIELSDDEDDCLRRSKVRRTRTECLNVECRSGNEYLDSVPAFVLTYYKVRRLKGLKICAECFNEACSYFSVVFWFLFSTCYCICDTQWRVKLLAA